MKKYLIKHQRIVIFIGFVLLLIVLLLSPIIAEKYIDFLNILGIKISDEAVSLGLTMELVSGLVFGVIVAVVAFGLQLIHENTEKKKLYESYFAEMAVEARTAFRQGKSDFNISRKDAMFYFDESYCNGLYQAVSEYRDYLQLIREYLGHDKLVDTLRRFIELMDSAYEAGNDLNDRIREFVNTQRFELNGPINTIPLDPFVCVRAMIFKETLNEDSLKMTLGIPQNTDIPGELNNMFNDVRNESEIVLDIRKIEDIKSQAMSITEEIKELLKKIELSQEERYNKDTMKQERKNSTIKKSILLFILFVVGYIAVVFFFKLIASRVGVEWFDDSDKENLVQIALLVGAILAFKETVSLRKLEHEPILSMGINNVKEGDKDEHMLDWCFAFENETKTKGKYLTIRNCGKGGAFNLKQERGDLRKVEIEKFSNLFVAPDNNVHVKIKEALDGYSELDDNQFVISCESIEGDQFFGRYSISDAEKGYVTLHEWTQNEADIGKNTI